MRAVLRIAFLVAVAWIVAGCDWSGKQPKKQSSQSASEVREGIGINDRAPEITGEDADGVKFKLSDYRGKVVLLDFWFER